jgi:6-phosphofructokinase 1
MMTIERVSTDPYVSRPGCEDIEKIANMVKGVPAEFINERGNGITDEGVKYLLPLIAGESYPVYENGLPVFLSLK